MTVLSVASGQSAEATLPAQLTTYIGRDREIAEAKRLLATASLVTLTGPGGVGKTRMASRVAAAVQESFPHGVVFVPLAELGEPELLVSALAERLGLVDRSSRPAVDLLVDALRDRPVLLVLDNCEHMVDACARLVETLIRSCSELVVLATSRQSLGVTGEYVLPLPPLAVPEPGEPAERLGEYDAARLLIDRAAAVVPTFAVTEDNAADVVRLCRQLDGLPLGIELAAVRLRALSVRQISERLATQLSLLTAVNRTGPTRHETLEALTEWSYDLCTDAERLLWARLTVFAGSFGLEAAEAVCAGDGLDEGELVDVIDGLIDKSILVRDEQQGSVRYRMLETLRQFGAARLRAAGEETRMQRRHRDWYLELVERFRDEWIGPGQRTWIAMLRREHADIRAAIDFCAADSDEAVIGLRMVYAFKEYWLLRGLNSEARLQRARLLAAAPEDAPGRATTYAHYAFLALIQGDDDAYTQAVADAEASSDAPAARAYLLHVRGYHALIGSDMTTAAELFGTATKLFAEQGDLGAELWSKFNLGISTALSGELDAGRQLLHDCIAAYTAKGEVFWRSWAVWSLAAAEYLAGDLDTAVSSCHEVLRMQQTMQDKTLIAFALHVAAGCAAHLAQDVRAAKLYGAAAAAWKALAASPMHYRAFVDPSEQDTAAVTGRIGADRAAAAFAEGFAMPIDAAIEYALDEQPGTARATPVNPLTKRENQIAKLVAEGLTNREIAERLVIAQRTAETHVEHIRSKLGFTNRAQVAAWVVDARRS